LLADRDDLVIAGSFLLTDAVTAAAAARPSGRFLLVDPLLMPAARSNLAVISFREDQAGFLAGALAAMVSRTKVLGGVYGPEVGAMTRYRKGFETGAATIDPAITVLGVYQPAADGRPFGNAEWGQEQASSWLSRGADVIFGAGGSTGEAALLPAAKSHRYCIGAGGDEFLTVPSAQACLLTSALIQPDRAIETAILSAADGHWTAGRQVFGIQEGAVGLAPFHQFETTVSAAMRARLWSLEAQLSHGEFLEGN
jgi:basic membrane protein A